MSLDKKKRERLDIIKDILQTVQHKEEIGPTRLLQHSNLSPKMFREYLGELIETELLQEIKDKKGKKKYHLTEKGYQFLERYNIFAKFIGNLGL